MDEGRLKKGIAAFKLFHEVGLADSNSAARRLLKDGGGYINGRRIEAFDVMITDNDLNNGEILLRAGKKRYHRIRPKQNFSGNA
jgi:tyrosyl-tRNA synthetase